MRLFFRFFTDVQEFSFDYLADGDTASGNFTDAFETRYVRIAIKQTNVVTTGVNAIGVNQ